MSILSQLSNLESSTIYKLQFDGRIVGLRVKFYSIADKEFLYFDFEISYVKNQSLRDYLNKHSREFEILELVEYNGLVCTQDEIDGKIVVKEFKDEFSAESILNQVICIMMEK